MEEKNIKRLSSFWALFNNWCFYKSIFRKSNLFIRPQIPRNVDVIQNSKFKIQNFLIARNNTTGFTLVELLIAIAMLSVMISLTILFIDPVTQLKKAKDAQKEQDFKQIVNALDTYYNDNNFYPASVAFGGNWSPYMQKVPQDSDCVNGGACYGYIADSVSSQWNVLFAKINKIEILNNIANPCPLIQIGCKPTNYDLRGYNYCVVSGNIDTSACAYINTHVVF